MANLETTSSSLNLVQTTVTPVNPYPKPSLSNTNTFTTKTNSYVNQNKVNQESFQSYQTTTMPNLLQTTTIQKNLNDGNIKTIALPGINSFSISGANLANAVYRDRIDSVGSVMGKRSNK